MKYLVIFIIIVIFLYIVVLRNEEKRFPQIIKCKVLSSKGTEIPAKLYLRKIQTIIDNKQKNIDEFIVSFDDNLINDSLNTRGDQKLYKYLLVIPSLKTIGLIEHTQDFYEKDTFLYQRGDEANNFTSIINNKTFFKNPPIYYADFYDRYVVFNSFGVLKKWGDTIIVQY